MTIFLTVIFEPSYGYLRGLVDDVGTAIRNYNGYIYIPNLAQSHI